MYTNKDSNLISYLRTKYGEDCVRLLRKWEITVKKMADYRNHRRLTLEKKVSLKSVVNSRIHLRPTEVMRSYTR